MDSKLLANWPLQISFMFSFMFLKNVKDRENARVEKKTTVI
jgi:hypothetical protein